MILDGKLLSSMIRSDLAQKSLCFFEKTGRRPALSVILVGNNPASLVYVNNKKKAAEEAGFVCDDIVLSESVGEEYITGVIRQLNTDNKVDGILVQLPLPPHIKVTNIINAISPSKDVDCFTPYNTGLLLTGNAEIKPCTPKGIFRLLNHYNIDLDGKNVCIIGRSNIVGRPMAALLMAETGSTVTVCNSHTINLQSFTINADVIISAAGQAGLVTADMVKPGAVVIDVGINRIPDSSKKSGYRLAGDVDFADVKEKTSYITPVPGGVGPMTVVSLLENTYIAALRHASLKTE